MMDKPKHTPDEADKAMQALFELFSNLPNTNNINRRKYVFELEDGEPVFRRDETDLAFDKIFDKVCGPNPNSDGDEIVPQKLAKQFPGRSRRRADR